MKKLLLSSLFIVMLLSVVACGGSEGTSGDQVDLSIFNIKVETKDQLENLIEKYEEEFPDVNIELTTVGGGQDAPAALQAKFASNDEPNIFLLGGLSDAEKYQDYLIDVSEMESAKTAIDGTLEGAMIDDVPYGIPLNIEGFGWMINKDIFEQAGIDLASIDSYQAFVEAVDTLESNKEELGLEAVFGFSGREDWVVGQYSAHFSSAEFDHSVVGAYESPELTYEFGDRFKEYTDIMNTHNVQPILSLDYSTSVEELFVGEKVAIIHQGNWIIPTLDSIDQDFASEKLGILPFFIESDTDGKIVAGPSWFWGINGQKDEAQVEQAKHFIDWMYTSDYGKDKIMTDFKYIPSHEGYDVDKLTDTVSKDIYQMLLDGQNGIWANNQYPDGFFSTVLFPELQKYLNGDQSWEEFTTTTSDQYKEMR
jgi:raffinose/stachyose/melibiose transport system substrate-binding protein